MPYTPTEWKTGDVISAERLNKVEQGIKDAHDDAADISSEISTEVASWLDEHVNVTEGVNIDDTLSVAGSAADAAKVGEELGGLKSQLSIISENVLNDGYTEFNKIYINPASGKFDSATGPKLLVFQIEPSVEYTIKKRTSTMMRIATGTIASPSSGDRYTRAVVHETPSSDPLVIKSGVQDRYLYVQLYTNSDSADLRSIEANIGSLLINANKTSFAAEIMTGHEIEVYGGETEITNDLIWANGRGVRPDGGASSNSTYKYSTKFPTMESDMIRLSMIWTTGSDPSYGIAFYDSNGDSLGGVKNFPNSETMTSRIVTLTLPSNVAYFATTWFNDGTESAETETFYCALIKKGKIAKLNGFTKSYLATEIEDTVAKIQKAQNEPNISFWWFTDAHMYSENKFTAGRSILDAIDAMKEMDKRVKMDFLLNTGDIFDGGGETRALDESYAKELNEALSTLGIPVLTAVGNHDTHYQYSSNADPFDYYSQFEYYFPNLKTKVSYNFATNGTDFYADFDEFKVRVIVINSNTDSGGVYKFNKQDTNNWFSNEALNTPDNYDVLIVSHLAPLARHNTNFSPSGGSDFSALMTGYETATKHLIAMIYGHCHRDNTFAEPYLAVASGCQKFENEESAHYEGWVKAERVLNTASEQLFNAIVLKPNSQKINLVRFGAGSDRILHYRAINLATAATVSLSSELTVTSWESLDSTIATVSNGVVTGVSAGITGIRAYDATGNYEMWRFTVA